MKNEILVHRCHLEVAGTQYEIHVYECEDGRHIAQTVLSRDDVLINDGPSLEEVLNKHCSLLPLAVDSRAILDSYRSSRN